MEVNTIIPGWLFRWTSLRIAYVFLHNFRKSILIETFKKFL